MLVTTLLVEGPLDEELLGMVFMPIGVESIGSKYALPPRTRELRKRKKTCGFLRDRDFDFDPPTTIPPQPQVAKLQDNQPLGWHWCRHEMENYMLEPEIVAAAYGIDADDFRAHLVAAGASLRNYQAARWVVGRVRRMLPPHYDLTTKQGDKEFYLPEEMSPTTSRDWVVGHVSRYGVRFCNTLDQTPSQYDQVSALFHDPHFLTPDNILTWFSGKDLMAGLRPWYTSLKLASGPDDFRNKLKNWMKLNHAPVLDLLPEWRNFKNLLEQA